MLGEIKKRERRGDGWGKEGKERGRKIERKSSRDPLCLANTGLKQSLLQDFSQPLKPSSALWLSKRGLDNSVFTCMTCWKEWCPIKKIMQGNPGENILALLPFLLSAARISALFSVSIKALSCPHRQYFKHHEKNASQSGLIANPCFLSVLQSLCGGSLHCNKLVPAFIPRRSTQVEEELEWDYVSSIFRHSRG